MSRRAARECLFKSVFAFCISGHDDFSFKKQLEEPTEKGQINQIDLVYINLAYSGIIQEFETLKEKISRWSEGFDFERIYKTDLAILLIATYEIFYIDEIPPLVSINEAVELAKEYSTEKSSVYINGILASALKEEF